MLNVPDVCFVGLGYVGLPTAALMAKSGLQVVGVDVDSQKIAKIRSSKAQFEEPGLTELLVEVQGDGSFRVSENIRPAKNYVIAVPTPFDSSRQFNFEFIKHAAESIAPLLRGGELLILESTSPPGTTERLRDLVHELRPDLIGASEGETQSQVKFSHCPERVLPGNALIEITSNDRLIGGVDKESKVASYNLYSHFCSGTLHVTDAKTAELAKLTENAYRDVNIAFANELARICDNLNVNVWEVIELANHHPRVNVHTPGPGVGGHCIPVDPWFIVSASSTGADLLKTARRVNDETPLWVASRIERLLDQHQAHKVAMLGLTYKAGTDDVRMSPSIEVVKHLSNARPETEILLADPRLGSQPDQLPITEFIKFTTAENAVNQADIVILLVDHREFLSLSKDTLSQKILLDTRNFLKL